jgi:hypothetical protein
MSDRTDINAMEAGEQWDRDKASLLAQVHRAHDAFCAARRRFWTTCAPISSVRRHAPARGVRGDLATRAPRFVADRVRAELVHTGSFQWGWQWIIGVRIVKRICARRSSPSNAESGRGRRCTAIVAAIHPRCSKTAVARSFPAIGVTAV